MNPPNSRVLARPAALGCPFSRFVASLYLVATTAVVASCRSGDTGSAAPGGLDAASSGADAAADASAGTDGTSADVTSLDSGAAPDGSDAAAHADSSASTDAGGDARSGDTGGFGDAGSCLDGGYIGCAVVLASGQNGPRDIAVDAVNVYWSNMGTSGASDGSIMKVPIGGGTPVTLASGLDLPEFITIDTTSVYWSNRGGSGLVMSVPIAGGTPVTIGTSNLPQDLAVDGTYVYWADQYDGAIYRAPIGGGTKITFAPAASPIGVAIDATHLYWTNDYLQANGPAGTITSKLLDGGAMTTLAMGQDTPEEIVIDGVNAYWRNLGHAGGPSGIGMAPLAGGAITFLRGNNGSPYLALDGQNLYFAIPSAVLSIPVPLSLDGGNAPTYLATLQQNPEGLAVDSTSLYWAVMSDGTIVKLTPK